MKNSRGTTEGTPLMDKSTISTRIGESSSFLDTVVMERASVRHGLAEVIELGSRAEGAWDSISHPFTNWGYANRLDYQLANHDSIARAKGYGGAGE